MAITLVDGVVTVASGEYDDISTFNIDLPSGMTAGDTIHVAICLPKYRWWGQSGMGFRLLRQYGISTPTGWVVAGSRAWNSQYALQSQGIIILLRRVAVGTEGATLAVPITRTQYNPVVPADNEVLQVAAAAVAHRGVSLSSPYATPPTFQWGGEVPWNSGALVDSHLVQLGFTVGIDINRVNPAVNDTVPPWDAPLPTRGQPPTWDVLDQLSTDAVETTGLYAASGAPSTTTTLVVRAAAMDTDTFTPGLAWFGLPPTFGHNTTMWHRVAFSLMDSSHGLAVDDPPPPGQPGVTGSGWLLPEWTGNTPEILTPLDLDVWVEGTDAYDMPALEPAVDWNLGPRPVGADVTFNGLGACTSAQITFAGNPGLTPYQHFVRLGFRTVDAPLDDPIPWWAGVVRNVRPDNGLWVVDVDGAWVLLNDARVQLDSGGMIDRPAHGVILGTLIVGIGDPTAVVIEAPADEQQTWSDHLNNTFRATPQAAWGIGPDQVFIMGLPEQGGVESLPADTTDAVTDVQQSTFILPPFVTEWWAEDNAGNVVSAELTPGPGLLVPSRIAQGRLDGLGNLLMPKEALYPITAGPTHQLEYAGIAVPPLRVSGLPSGEEQMVASARVVVTVGEEGSMPRITTTLTTVALPYEGG